MYIIYMYIIYIYVYYIYICIIYICMYIIYITTRFGIILSHVDAGFLGVSWHYRPLMTNFSTQNEVLQFSVEKNPKKTHKKPLGRIRVLGGTLKAAGNPRDALGK